MEDGGTFPHLNWKKFRKANKFINGCRKMYKYVFPTRNQNHRILGGAYGAEGCPM